MAEDAYCSECKYSTEIVVDHSTGDTVCSECGLVLESYLVDERSEWRTFADETSDNDPNRVGNAANPLLSGSGLTTMISKDTNNKTGDMGWLRYRFLSDPDQALVNAFSEIAAMCDRLGLVATVKDRANEIYKKVGDKKTSKGLKKQVAVLAACLYIACRQEDKPRTVKEIAFASSGTTRKEIGRAKEFIVKQLESEMVAEKIKTVHGGDFMRRFFSNLGINSYQTVKAAQEAVQKSQEFDIRRSPLSIAAAIIYVITQLSNDKRPLKDVVTATGVAQGTIKNTYKDLKPYISEIIPSWYAQEGNLNSISNP